MTKLMSRLDGKPLKDPKILKFVTGRRKQMWVKNVVAFGLASGFLEPLESTSIHLVQSGIARLLTYFPRQGISEPAVAQYNREALAEYDNIKDFLIAHYHVTDREDTPFWAYCRHMAIPDSLSDRLDLFRQSGQMAVVASDLFKETNWFSVLTGQGIMPENYHPVADLISEDELKQRLARVRDAIQQRVDGLTGHDAYIARHCLAKA